jgi:WXXGXW repeat (2 copies)
MRHAMAIRSSLLSFVLLVLCQVSFGQVSISVSFGPPALPVYEQPICPDDGYIWVPGYWAYDNEYGYYWIPGTWVEGPEPGYLWTPPWWGWADGAYVFHEGYWGEHIGFYGGINYGFGYFGHGYDGGRWQNGHFYYNTYVNHVNTTVIHNTYNTRVVENNVHISYNGGNGGVNARPTAEEETYGRERHIAPVSAQTTHIQQARSNPQLRASANQGKPPIAATAKAGDFRTGAVGARQAGGTYKAPPANAARGGNENRPATEARPENRPANTHASEIQPHQYTPPSTGNAKADQKYQQQQQKLATKQNQEHQKLQQQQEKEHQQAQKRNASEAQKQQMEQRHAQQTQQLEQKHATQHQELEKRQAPRQNEAKPEQKPH